MSKRRKVTLEDIKRRKAEVARQIEETRIEVKDEIYDFTHPFNRIKRNLSLSSIQTVGGVVGKAVTAYKVAKTVISFFKKR